MDSLLYVLSENIVYSISGGAIALLLAASLRSNQLREGLTAILWIVTIFWGICVGYEANTGNDIGYFFDNYGKDSGILKPVNQSK